MSAAFDAPAKGTFVCAPKLRPMFYGTAKYYDAVYRALGKDYQAEAQKVAAIILREKRSAGSDLLDVACGTGRHLQYLQKYFRCEGLDIADDLLRIAAERCASLTFHRADMMYFNLERQYDAVVCLFSSIAYVTELTRLKQTIATFKRHLKPGGVMLVEPWIYPEHWQEGLLSAVFVDEPDLKLARMMIARRNANVSILDFHYMVGEPDGIRTLTEPHHMGLFTPLEYRDAFESAGLHVGYDEQGLTGRGLFIATEI